MTDSEDVPDIVVCRAKSHRLQSEIENSTSAILVPTRTVALRLAPLRKVELLSRDCVFLSHTASSKQAGQARVNGEVLPSHQIHPH